MNGIEFLKDFHQRVGQNFSKLIDHCKNLTPDQLNKELDGFGYPTVRLQLHHMIGAEKYWIGVIYGRIDAEENDHLYPTIESLEAYKNSVDLEMTDLLNKITEDELLTARSMMTWSKVEKVMRPLDIILRTQTHKYHHQGQILAMCRLMGKPATGFDYPLA